MRDNTVNIGIIGARANESIKKILAENGANVAFDLTCTGLGRKILVDETDVMTGYARGLLSQFPCMRMEQAGEPGRTDPAQRRQCGRHHLSHGAVL